MSHHENIDEDSSRKNLNSTSEKKEYTKYKGLGLPVRGLRFISEGDIIFCNDYDLVFLDLDLETEIAVIPAHSRETSKLQIRNYVLNSA